MSRNLTPMGADAADTLWPNDRFFLRTQVRVADLPGADTDADHLMKRLAGAERRHVGHYTGKLVALVHESR